MKILHIMENTLSYLNFIKEKDKPISEINPSSGEIALAVKNADPLKIRLINGQS